MTFAKILERINGGSHGRAAGGATPPVCEVWKESDAEGKLLINAILGFEIVNERKARPDDETGVLEVLAELKAGIARGKP